jgi:hypothetical protein
MNPAMQKLVPLLILTTTLTATLAAAEAVRLRVDFAKPDGTWNMPALALGQGGLQGDPMIEPHIKVIHFGRSNDLGNAPLKLKPWDVRWIEIE